MSQTAEILKQVQDDALSVQDDALGLVRHDDAQRSDDAFDLVRHDDAQRSDDAFPYSVIPDLIRNLCCLYARCRAPGMGGFCRAQRERAERAITT